MAMGTMATGAKEPDWQAAIDDSLSTFASVMTNADMMNGCGLLNGSKILSYPHMVMETEIYGIVQKVADGIVVDDETLALDVIKKVGPNGTYLAEKHTRQHMKEIWRPTVWDRTPYDTWLREGKKGALEKATEIADDILANYQPEPLPEDVVKELRAIVARADKELAGPDARRPPHRLGRRRLLARPRGDARAARGDRGRGPSRRQPASSWRRRARASKGRAPASRPLWWTLPCRARRATSSSQERGASGGEGHARRGELGGLELEDGRSYFGTGSDCVYVTDPDTGERRRSTTADVEGMAALAEKLPNLDFVMSMGLPSDVRGGGRRPRPVRRHARRHAQAAADDGARRESPCAA